MFCKVCNTRLGANDRHCPNCGQDAPAEAAFTRTSPPSPLPKSDLSGSQDALETEDIVELDDVSGEGTPPPKKAKPPQRKVEKPAPRKAEKPAARTASKKPPARPAPRPASDSGANTSTGSSLFAPDPAGLRTLLAEMPQALEPGLEIYRDDAGESVGAGYSSGVGDIDLLAHDENGDLVVVMISEKGQGEELIGEVLQRVGWVRKHVGKGKMQVRGIVLCEEPPEGLSYAAAAVAGTVAFKTYRVALTFEDLEI